MSNLRLTPRAQKLLTYLMTQERPLPLNLAYTFAGLIPPTNGSDEMALRVIGNKTGIRYFCNIEVNGVLNPLKSDGVTAANISPTDYIKFCGFKNNAPNLSQSNIVGDEIGELFELSGRHREAGERVLNILHNKLREIILPR